MSDKFSPSSNFGQAHLVGGVASDDIDNQLLHRLDPTTKRLLVATTTDIAQTEDAAHSSGDTGVMSLAVRNDTLAALAGTDGDYAPLQVNANGELYVASGHGITGIGHGVKTITTAGSDETLAASTTCKKVNIQAQTDNTGLIAVGGSGVDATEATGSGILLYAGDTVTIEIDDLEDIYIDSTVNGEGVRYNYFT